MQGYLSSPVGNITYLLQLDSEAKGVILVHLVSPHYVVMNRAVKFSYVLTEIS